jgi:hypothetical protein
MGWNQGEHNTTLVCDLTSNTCLRESTWWSSQLYMYVFSASLDPLIGLQLAELGMVHDRCVGECPYCYRDGLSGTQVCTSETSECRLPLIS